MMIEHLPHATGSEEILPHINSVIDKVNELVDKANEYETHVHYSREMQLPTSTPNNTEVYS